MSNERARFVARWARRVPGYHRVSRAAIGRLRENDLAGDVLRRVVGDVGRLGMWRNPLTTPDVGAAEDPDRWPVLAVVVDDIGQSGTGRLVDEMVDLQRRLRCFRPLLVLSAPEVAAVRAAGLPYEILPPGLNDDSEVAAHCRATRARRLVSITDHYGTWQLVRAEGDHLSREDVDLLEALAGYLHTQWARRAADQASTA